MAELNPTPDIPPPNKTEDTSLDFSQTFILPSIQKHFPSDITVHQELQWFRDQQAKHRQIKRGANHRFYGSRHWDSFNSLRAMENQLELKASQFLQHENLDVVSPLYLSTRGSGSGFELKNLIRASDKKEKDRYSDYFVDVNPSSILSVNPDRGKVDRLGVNWHEFPFQNKQNPSKWDRKPISYRNSNDGTDADNTGVLFFRSPNDYNTQTALYTKLYHDLNGKTPTELATILNGLPGWENKIKLDLLPDLEDAEFPPVVRRIVTRDVSIAQRMQEQHEKGAELFNYKNPKLADPLSLLFRGNPENRKDVALMEKDLLHKAREDEVDEYWKTVDPGWDARGGADYWPVKFWLAKKIREYKWTQPEELGGLSDAEKQGLKTLGGAAAFFMNGKIKTDIEGYSLDRFGVDSESRDTAREHIDMFLTGQYELMRDKFPARYGYAADSPYSVDIDNSIENIKRIAQGMVSYKGANIMGVNRGSPETDANTGEIEGEGFLLEEGLDPQKQYEILKRQGALLQGRGMAGATPEEMDNLAKVLIQHAELVNAAALAGETHKPWDDRAKLTYKDDTGKRRLYDFRFRDQGLDFSGGAHQPRPDMSGQPRDIQSARKENIDPNWRMIRNFTKSLENYAVISGRKGHKITPLLSWLGKEAFHGNKLWPLRLSNMQLMNTDVEEELDWRDLGNVIDPSIFGINVKMLHAGQERVSGGAEGQGHERVPSEIQGGGYTLKEGTKAHKEESKFEELARQQEEAKVYPKRDINKDGKVSVEERKKATGEQ